MPKKIYKIPAIWQMYGVCNIEAESLEEAKEIALNTAPVPAGTYIDDSFELDDGNDLEALNEEE